MKKAFKKFLKSPLKLRIFALVICVVVLLSALLVFINYSVDKAVYKERQSSLKETTVASAMTVNSAVNGYRRSASILKNIVEMDLSEHSTVEDFIDKAKYEITDTDNMIFLVDDTGRYFSSDEHNGMISDLEYYKSSTGETEEYLSTLPHLNQNKTYFIIRKRLANPITINSVLGNVTIKYAAIMYDLEELNETISTLFPGANNTFIYQSSTGTMLYKEFSIGLLIDGYNIYPKYFKSEIVYNEDADEIIKQCKNREVTVTELKIDGDYFYACSSPIDSQNWSLMFIVQQKYMDESAGSYFQNLFYFITAIVVFLGLAMIAYVITIFTRSAKKGEFENQMIVNALSGDFETVMHVPYMEDKFSDTAHIYRKSAKISRNIPEIEDNSGFSRMLDMISDHIENKEERKEFIKATRREVIIDKLEKSQSHYFTFKLMIDGKNEYHEIQFSPVLDENDENTGFVTGIRSVDNEIKERMEIQEKLKDALEAANSASEAKTTFLFNMSHDIRTPMNAIIGFTNMAIRDIDNKEKTVDSLKKIQKSGDILLSLINDILEMSRIESGKITIAENAADVTKCFENIIPVMNDLAKAKDITVTYKIEDIRDRYIYLDTLRVQRILMNLISNSVKYTKDGGWVSVNCSQLDISKPGYAYYRFTVEDNGIGMSEEFQKHLFEEFAREETATTSGIQGTGLGLALVKSLTELMGGTVSVTSKLGIGSKFTVEIGFRLQPESEIKIHKAEEEEEVTLDGKRVLLVEDNELNREIATDILEEQGLSVYTAEDGAEAVDRLRKNGPAAYDFILMDIQMPVMDGYEAARTIRELWPDNKIIIIALSANAFEEDKRKSIEAGMNDHIAKPINVDELISTIKKFF